MFAETLKQLRMSRCLSQKQFAKELYISPSAVSQYETGCTMPSRENLERIAKYFGVSTDYLLGSSPIAELEEQMNQEYCNGVRVSDFLGKCMCLPGKHRETLLDVLDALLLSADSGKK